MKQSKLLFVIILTTVLGFILATCQKEPLEDQMIFGTVLEDVLSPLQQDNIRVVLTEIAFSIDSLLGENMLNEGNANSFVTKVQNALKSLEKGNNEAFSGQLNAFINETQAFIGNGSLPEDRGNRLINKAEIALIAEKGSIVDPRDGYEYPVSLIGTQLWFAENLRATTYNDDTEIPYVPLPTAWAAQTEGAYTWFAGNYDMFGSVYGAMYNWYAVATGNLCPDGWHVSSHLDWFMLSDYLGGTEIAGGKLKEEGTAHWLNPNVEADNCNGFTALPCGQRGPTGGYANPWGLGNWWTSTVMIPGLAGWGRYILNFRGNLGVSGYANKMGLYVRCVHN